MATEHRCGVQGFDAYKDTCEACEEGRMTNPKISNAELADMFAESARLDHAGSVLRPFHELAATRLRELDKPNKTEAILRALRDADWTVFFTYRDVRVNRPPSVSGPKWYADYNEDPSVAIHALYERARELDDSLPEVADE